MKNTFAWSVRRELWEHRSVWIAPLAVCVLVMVAGLLGANRMNLHVDGFANMPAAKQHLIAVIPFSMAGSVVLLTALVVAVFYCMDALNAERRDRSILFWKSMPVSDATTVLSKFFVPTVVMPVIAYAIAVATQLLLLVLVIIAGKVQGLDAAPVLERVPFLSMIVTMLYGVVVHTLWYAPIYALILLLGAATRRPFIWLVVPAILVQVLERLAFGTSHAGDFIAYRIAGAVDEAFKPNATNGPIVSFSQLDPARFISTPGLWLGLLAAAALLYVAIRLRRSREPL